MKILLKQQALLMTMLWVVCVSGNTAMAEVAVVVNPGNASSPTPDDIQNIFLGKKNRFPDGSEAVPLNLKLGDDVREKFDKTVNNKTPSQMKAYWSKIVFTGKGNPPKEVDSDSDCKEEAADNANVICYIDSAKVDASVKVVHRF